MKNLSFGALERGENVVSGSIASVIYANDENGYTVLRLNLDEGGTVTLVVKKIKG